MRRAAPSPPLLLPPRCTLQMTRFALNGYESMTPQPLHKTPNSVVGRALGLVYR